MSDFDEVFDFIRHERPDIRKMAVQGLASHSKDNTALSDYLLKHPKAIESLCVLLRLEESQLLGDLFTVLINICTVTEVADVVVKEGAVHKTLRLMDMIDRSDSETVQQISAVLHEMALMLLNNLTASAVKAVYDTVQHDDEDLRGFYLSKLSRYYEKDESNTKVRRWVLNILLNCTRVVEGQIVLLEEDDWKDEIRNLMTSEDDSFGRLVAIQITRNCCVGRAQALTIELRLPHTIVEILQKPSVLSAEEQLLAVETISIMLGTEPGMQLMEGINAKKMLQTGMDQLVDEAKLALEKDVLPFLDDIEDVYVMNDRDEN